MGLYEGKGKTKIDPKLCRRPKLEVNGKLYFDKPMYTTILKKQGKAKSYRLVIPDNEMDQFAFTESDQDFEHDYGIIHQFSELLSTTESNISLLENYTWTNGCDLGDDTLCIRVLERCFLKFEIKSGDVKFVDALLLSQDQADILLFGHFSGIKMRAAQPGDKISEFIP